MGMKFRLYFPVVFFLEAFVSFGATGMAFIRMS